MRRRIVRNFPLLLFYFQPLTRGSVASSPIRCSGRRDSELPGNVRVWLNRCLPPSNIIAGRIQFDQVGFAGAGMDGKRNAFCARDHRQSKRLLPSYGVRDSVLEDRTSCYFQLQRAWRQRCTFVDLPPPSSRRLPVWATFFDQRLRGRYTKCR